MASGLELEIAQCIVDATYALDIVFNCAVQAISSVAESPESGVGGHGNFFFLGKIPALQLPELISELNEESKRQEFLKILIPLYENHGIRWEDVAGDYFFYGSRDSTGSIIGCFE